MLGALMLEADYSTDKPTHTPKDFQWHFRMNMELFKWNVYGVMEHNDYFMCRKDCMRLVSFRNAEIP
jgi:hypothetical protein